MIQKLELLFFLTLVTIGISKEEKRKALIIAIDEKNPEKSDAIIYNLTLQEQSSSPKHTIIGESYGRNGLRTSPNDKDLGYIIVTPEELKRLQNVDGITVEEPRHISYPPSNSEENYDSGRYSNEYSSLPIRSSYPDNPTTDSKEYYNSPGDGNRYPKRPAPPLYSLSSSNNSNTGYGPLSDSNYNSPPSNHYGPYGSEETNEPERGSPYNPNSPISESPYSSPEYGHKNHYPPRTEYSPNHGSYETHPAHKSNEVYYSDPKLHRPMYSGYKAPPTSSYDSKYESEPNYSSGPNQPNSSYYTDTGNTNGNTYGNYISSPQLHKTPREMKFSEPLYRSVGKPLSDTSDSSKHQYGSNASPVPYDTLPHDSQLPYSQDSYGTREKYNSPSSSYTGAHSSPHLHSDFSPEHHSSKDFSNTPTNSYTGRYNSDSLTGKRPLYDNSEHTKEFFNKPNSLYSHSSGISSYDDVPPSGTASKNQRLRSYRNPSLMSSYESTKSAEKPYYSSYERNPKDDSYDPATYETYGSEKFPSKYTSLTNNDAVDHDSYNPHLHQTIPSYKTKSQPDSPVVTRFYETPNQNSGGYHFKYPDTHKISPLSKPKQFDSSRSLSHHSTSKPIPYGTSLKNDLSTKNYDHLNSQITSAKNHDTHSVSKNYKPSRPAPLHDEYEQPRYPPLPVDIPHSSTEKDSHGHYADHSKEENVYHRNNGNSKYENSYPNSYEKSYPNLYDPSPYHSDYINNKSPLHYSPKNDSSYYSSYEDDHEPIYTKTITKSYSKPYTDSPIETDYNNYSPDSSHVPRNKHSPSSTLNFPAKKTRSYIGSSQYSKPYSHSADEYSDSKPLRNKEKKFRYYTQDDKAEFSPTYVSESEQPKRVVGVVYRSRKTYPSLRNTRRRKNYLPYKVYNPESSPAVDYKVYENAPEKNVSNPPLKNAIKLMYRPLKKESIRENFKDDSYDESYESDAFANIPGEAGKDFPVLKEIPQTYFSCNNRASGFYADIENRCQVYHQCSDNGKIQSFLCPNGTIFNQLTFVCEWWHNVDCDESEKHFDKNNELYKLPASTAGNQRVNTESYPYSAQHAEQDKTSEYYQGEKDGRANRYEKAAPRSRRKKQSIVTYN